MGYFQVPQISQIYTDFFYFPQISQMYTDFLTCSVCDFTDFLYLCIKKKGLCIII